MHPWWRMQEKSLIKQSSASERISSLRNLTTGIFQFEGVCVEQITKEEWKLALALSHLKIPLISRVPPHWNSVGIVTLERYIKLVGRICLEKIICSIKDASHRRLTARRLVAGSGSCELSQRTKLPHHWYTIDIDHKSKLLWSSQLGRASGFIENHIELLNLGAPMS